MLPVRFVVWRTSRLLPAETISVPPVFTVPVVTDGQHSHRGPITSTAVALVYAKIRGLVSADAFSALEVTQATSTLQSAMENLFSVPWTVPPLLYSRVLPTSMQLSLFPFPRPGQVLTAASGHEFVLRVEGVIRTSTGMAENVLDESSMRTRRHMRRVAMMDVGVTLTCAGEVLQTLSERVGLTATSVFTASFAFALPVVDAGEMPLTICVAPTIVDQGGICWATHASESFNFRVLSKQKMAVGGRSTTR